jgi:hypothetical protein
MHVMNRKKFAPSKVVPRKLQFSRFLWMLKDFCKRCRSLKHVTSSMHVMQLKKLLSCRVVQRKFQNLCRRSWISVDAHWWVSIEIHARLQKSMSIYRSMDFCRHCRSAAHFWLKHAHRAKRTLGLWVFLWTTSCCDVLVSARRACANRLS